MANDNTTSTLEREEAFYSLSRYFSQGDYTTTSLARATVQRLRTLEYLAKTLSAKQHLRLSAKKRAILFLALYEAYFLQKPSHATTYEMVELAKRHTNPHFARFVNALLRKISDKLPALPPTPSILYSYPEYFVNRQPATILEAMNHPSPLMARRRDLPPSPEAMILLDEVKHSPNLYIQNITPVALASALAAHTPTPSRILDLCAAPGGKLLLAHDLFPTAALVAHDASTKRLVRLQENIEKYALPLLACTGSLEEVERLAPYDLVIIDAPCSNSGVLHKRPEARWRLSEESVLAHQTLQKELLALGKKLLSPSGVIWYMTCSILHEENEEVVRGPHGHHPLPQQGRVGWGVWQPVEP